jgi:hypothetical protein
LTKYARPQPRAAETIDSYQTEPSPRPDQRFVCDRGVTGEYADERFPGDHDDDEDDELRPGGRQSAGTSTGESESSTIKCEDALNAILAQGDRITKAESTAKADLEHELAMKRCPGFAEHERDRIRRFKARDRTIGVRATARDISGL